MIGSSKLSNQGIRPLQSSTLSGSAGITSTTGPFGDTRNCLAVGGATDGAAYLSTTLSAPELFSGEGTVEFWFYNANTNYPATYSVFYDQAEVSTEIRLLLRNNSSIAATARFGATTYTTTYGTLNTNSWNHVALTLEGNTYLTLWVNGLNIGSVGTGTDTLVTSLGSINRLAYQSSDGYICDYRLSTRARWSRLDSSFRVPNKPLDSDQYTYWLMPLDNSTLYDNGLPREPKPVSVVGNSTVTTSVGPYSDTTSTQIDGSGDSVDIPNTLDLGTGDFTIEFYARTTSIGTNQYLFDLRSSSTSVQHALLWHSDGSLRDYVYPSYRITSSTLSNNTWYHIALMRIASSTYLFIDGTSVNFWFDSNDYNIGSATTLKWGNSSLFNTQGLIGYIDGIRVSSVARYSGSGFTAPTERYENDDHTIFLLNSTIISDDNR